MGTTGFQFQGSRRSGARDSWWNEGIGLTAEERAAGKVRSYIRLGLRVPGVGAMDATGVPLVPPGSRSRGRAEPHENRTAAADVAPAAAGRVRGALGER
jgi:hypothetical protein